MAQQILTISEINEYIRSVIDRDLTLTNVAVKGEISNYKIYPSGHHYFTLKDDNASLKCVMFRGNTMRLKFQPENGMRIIAIGKIGVYPRDGAYQLYCNAIVSDGIGDLHTAFEQLKTKLAAKGLFDPAHKKDIPQYPSTIGVITSSAGAAIHDILRILRKRYPLTQVKLLPVRVQGSEAPHEIASAICYANAHKLADLLIVGRGGGSIEDLWAFNDEQVAYEIYNSNIPIISAVGHEPDVTISDYVADLRAATPSNAAELATPDANVLKQMIDTMFATMCNAIMRDLKSAKLHLNTLKSNATLQDPMRYLQEKRNALQIKSNMLLSKQQQLINLIRREYVALTAKLDALSPLKVLTRGYAILNDEKNDVVYSVHQVKISEKLDIRLQDGKISATIQDITEETI